MTKNNYVLQNGKFLDFVFDFSLPNSIYIVECKTSDGKEQLKIIIATFIELLCSRLYDNLFVISSNPCNNYSFKNNLSTYYVQIQVYITFLFCI